MGRQSKLVLLLLLSIGTLQVARTLRYVHDDIPDSELDSAETLPDISAHKKLNTIVKKDLPVSSTKSSEDLASASASTTHKPVSEEILNDLIEASKHSVALADDPRFNKMLPEKFKLENATTTNKSDEEYDYDGIDYDDDYDYSEETTTTKKLSKSTTAKPTLIENANDKKVEMKPIKDPKSKNTHIIHDDILDKSNAIDDEDDDEDDYNSSEDDIADEEEIIFNENVPCPRYCVCARNINSYLVATCSRFDPGTQKFGSDITDLIVMDVGPKYPILLGPDFFRHMGLKRVSSIKIANCTIEYLHPDAFNGLDELYSVNLTNVGLAIINPDTFAKNKKLRMLTISGNDLSVMSSVHYLLNSSTIEELDLSRNHLTELNPNAFSKLSNIVYINLSQNELQKIPEHVFDAVETIEELDLSFNNLKTLPAGIFNRTALGILSLKYNSITGDLHFGTSDLQQLDLSFNSMNQIHHGMFDKMTGLTNLNLKGNGITKIQPDSFLTLKNLRHIDLSINELDQVSSMIFYKNSELDVIRLNDNPKLSQLPTDGFLSYNGYFTVYYLDISNCAIGALGHKTFSTMPNLATLKLAWNNINNLERDTFATLKKLIDLDLSNNLIAKLDELTFMNNNDMVKLNLAGNPIRKLSVRLFLPLSKLRELDVSDCELNSLLTDNQFGVGRKYKFYDTLRSFNASANQIRRVASSDIKNFKNLRTLDISHNPLKCNEDFQDFISYVSLKNMVPNKMPTLANIENSVTYVKFQSQPGWAEFAHEVCKHHDSMTKSKEEKLENRIELADKDLDEDAKNLLNIMENSQHNKMQTILKDSDKNSVVTDDHLSDSLDEDVSEHDLNNAEEHKDDDVEENESDYNNADEDDDDDDDEENDDDYDADTKDAQRKDDALGLSKETKNKWTKFILDGNDENTDNDVDEEIIIEHGRIYYSGYKFLVPVAIVVSCVVILLLAFAKMISVVMRKRGERYRMALLASSKNSIVYQKLTEDIKPTTTIRDTKPPKVHRYAPINQV